MLGSAPHPGLAGHADSLPEHRFRRERGCQAFCSPRCFLRVICPQFLNNAFPFWSSPPDYIALFKRLALVHWPLAYWTLSSEEVGSLSTMSQGRRASEGRWVGVPQHGSCDFLLLDAPWTLVFSAQPCVHRPSPQKDPHCRGWPFPLASVSFRIAFFPFSLLACSYFNILPSHCPSFAFIRISQKNKTGQTFPRASQVADGKEPACQPIQET